MHKIEELSRLIESSQNICVFTGAGVSCASGIPDFRSADGLYNRSSGYKYSPEEIISHTFFVQNPEIFYDFYKNNMLYLDARPNSAHMYFADLERRGKNVSVVTQNIDGLHSLAGSKNVMEIHGSVLRNYCTRCAKPYSAEYIKSAEGVPRCKEDSAIIKPDVVLYEEPLDEAVVNRAIDAILNAELMIVAGTSLSVYPAASYLRFFRGNALVLINKSSTPYDNRADIVFHEDIIEVIKSLENIG